MNPSDIKTGVEQAPAPVPQPNATPLGSIAANMSPNAAAGNFAPSLPDIAPTMPETAPIQSAERLSNPETQIGPAISGTPTVQQPAVLPVIQPAPTAVQPVSDDNSTTTTAPTTAADEDLIEKEWVAKAKQVISATRNDPHEQAKQIAALMRDYVKKRYGREVGKAPEDL